LTTRRIVFSLIVWLAGQLPFTAHANQDPLSKARELYLSADYEGALVVLDGLDHDAGGARTEVAEYRVFCLLALERTDGGSSSHQGAHRDRPLLPYFRDTSVAAIAEMFQETRKTLLPDVVQRLYNDAKTLFDRHDPAATRSFERLICAARRSRSPRRPTVRSPRGRHGFRDLSATARAEVQLKPGPTTAAPSADEVRLKPDSTITAGVRSPRLWSQCVLSVR